MSFSCNQVPLRITTSKTLNEDIASISDCKTCKLKLHSYDIADATLTDVSGVGVKFDENSKTTLRMNRIDYGFFEACLIRKGHELGRIFDAEVQFFFYHAKHGYVCLAIPLIKETGQTNKYFSALKEIARRPPITSLLTQTTKFLTYRAPKRDACLSNVFYIVSTTPASISTYDYNRLLPDSLFKDVLSDPRTTVSISGYASEFTRIDGIRLEDATSAIIARNPSAAATNYVPTSQVKCRPLDPTRDIKGDSLYVGGDRMPGDTTLADEMAKAATVDGGGVAPTVTVESIESVVGIVIGSFIGAILLILLMSFFYRKGWLNFMLPSKLKKQIAVVGGSLRSYLR